MGTSGDKIVLLDGMGSGSGSATNGLLSMIPGMFANLIGGNKMDPNLVASVTSSMVPSRICAGDAGVVTTEEQTPMTRIISGI